MSEFVIEFYVPRADPAAAERSAGGTRRAAEEMAREGIPVRLVRSIFMPEDETCLLLVEAPTGDAVREVARRAGLTFERIARAGGDRGRGGEDG